MWCVTQQFAPPVLVEKCTSGCALPSRSRAIGFVVHLAPGSVSFGLDCQAGLPLAKMMARSSPPPFGRATTASNSFRDLVLALSRPSFSSHAVVPASCANATGANASAARVSQRNLLSCMVKLLPRFVRANLPRRALHHTRFRVASMDRRGRGERSMHQYQRWRTLIGRARTRQDVDQVVREYVACLLPSELLKLPESSQAAV